jgi:hypothetical protein
VIDSNFEGWWGLDGVAGITHETHEITAGITINQAAVVRDAENLTPP